MSTITGTPRSFWLTHAATSVVAIGLQVAGVYAAVLTFGVLLTVGAFSDRVGRRPVLLCAMGLSAASARCFVGETGLPLLFVGRLLCGFAGGLLSGSATAAVMEAAIRPESVR